MGMSEHSRAVAPPMMLGGTEGLCASSSPHPFWVGMVKWVLRARHQHSRVNIDASIYPTFWKTSTAGSCPLQLSWLRMALPSRELGEAKAGPLPSPSSSLTENWGPQPPSSSLHLQTCWMSVLTLVSYEHFGQSLESSSTDSILLRLISL